jgi:hypothetical protein
MVVKGHARAATTRSHTPTSRSIATEAGVRALTRASGCDGIASSHCELGGGIRSANITERCAVKGAALSAHASAVPTTPPPTMHTSTVVAIVSFEGGGAPSTEWATCSVPNTWADDEAEKPRRWRWRWRLRRRRGTTDEAMARAMRSGVAIRYDLLLRSSEGGRCVNFIVVADEFPVFQFELSRQKRRMVS